MTMEISKMLSEFTQFELETMREALYEAIPHGHPCNTLSALDNSIHLIETALRMRAELHRGTK